MQIKLIKSGNRPPNKQKRTIAQAAVATEELEYAVVEEPCKCHYSRSRPPLRKTAHNAVSKTKFIVDSLVLILCQQPTTACIKRTSVDS